MSEVIKNKYLDFSGLKKYDNLIKGLIKSGNDELAAAIAALDAKIGSLEVEGSDSKNLAEIVEEIYSSIEKLVVTQESLEAKDAELEANDFELAAKDVELEAKDAELAEKINKIVGDLELLEDSDSILTIVDICNNLKALNVDVAKNTQDIVGVESRLSAVEKTVADLGKIEGGESLGDIVNKVNTNAVAIATLNGEGEGSVKKTAADAAAQALADAKVDAESKYQVKGDYEVAGTAAGLNAAMNERVAKLEEIDHEQLIADAIADVIDGAESDFDTLKEVADWIAADKEGSAALQTTVSGHTESINTINGELDALEAKVDGDIANLTQHVTDAANALAQVETALDARIDVLEAFEETHESISLDTIEGLFA